MRIKNFWLGILLLSLLLAGCFRGGTETQQGSLKGEIVDISDVSKITAPVSLTLTGKEPIVVEDGMYNFPNVSVGPKVLTAFADGYKKYSSPVTIMAGKTITHNIELEKEADVPIVPTVEIPRMPASLMDNASSSALSTLQNDGWGRYQVIPQISHNYNNWIDYNIEALVRRMMEIQPQDEEFRIDGNLTTIAYEHIEDDLYDIQITFTLQEIEKIQAIFYRNATGTEYRLILKDRNYHYEGPGGHPEEEIREIIFSDYGYEKHVRVLYFRKNTITPDNKVADMNDIIEIRESGSEKSVKCVRVYGLGESWDDQHIIHFSAITDLLGVNEPTTGRYFWNEPPAIQLKEIEESPALFNIVEKWVGVLGPDETKDGYPLPDDVLAVYNQGVGHNTVQDAEICPETLESNFLDLVSR